MRLRAGAEVLTDAGGLRAVTRQLDARVADRAALFAGQARAACRAEFARRLDAVAADAREAVFALLDARSQARATLLASGARL